MRRITWSRLTAIKKIAWVLSQAIQTPAPVSLSTGRKLRPAAQLAALAIQKNAASWLTITVPA